MCNIYVRDVVLPILKMAFGLCILFLMLKILCREEALLFFEALSMVCVFFFFFIHSHAQTYIYLYLYWCSKKKNNCSGKR